MVAEREVKRYQPSTLQETKGANPREEPPLGPGHGNSKSRGPYLRKSLHKRSPAVQFLQTSRIVQIQFLLPHRNGIQRRPPPRTLPPLNTPSPPLNLRLDSSLGTTALFQGRDPFRGAYDPNQELCFGTTVTSLKQSTRTSFFSEDKFVVCIPDDNVSTVIHHSMNHR